MFALSKAKSGESLYMQRKHKAEQRVSPATMCDISQSRINPEGAMRSRGMSARWCEWQRHSDTVNLRDNDILNEWV